MVRSVVVQHQGEGGGREAGRGGTCSSSMPAGRQSGRGGRVLRRRNSEMIGNEGRERQTGSDKSVGQEAA